MLRLTAVMVTGSPATRQHGRLPSLTSSSERGTKIAFWCGRLPEAPRAALPLPVPSTDTSACCTSSAESSQGSVTLSGPPEPAEPLDRRSQLLLFSPPSSEQTDLSFLTPSLPHPHSVPLSPSLSPSSGVVQSPGLAR